MKRTGWLAPLLVVVELVVCDQVAKQIAVAHLRDGPGPSVLSTSPHLTYAENHDVAFSLLSFIAPDVRLGLIIATGLSAVVLLALIWWRRAPHRTADRTAYVLMLGGALGNLLDRVVRGFVVDFIHIPSWPVFNLADVFIVVGVVLFLWSMRPQAIRRAPA